MDLENASPEVHQRAAARPVRPEDEDDSVVDKFDAREIFGEWLKTFVAEILRLKTCIQTDLLRSINDPEHPLTLEELNVIQQSEFLWFGLPFWTSLSTGLIEVDNEKNYVRVRFTPTIPHCSMATLIGLCVRVRLLRALPPRFKVDVEVTPGTHASEDAGCGGGLLGRLSSTFHNFLSLSTVNKQLGDKERVAAALENANLLEVVNQCLKIKEVVQRG